MPELDADLCNEIDGEISEVFWCTACGGLTVVTDNYVLCPDHEQAHGDCFIPIRVDLTRWARWELRRKANLNQLAGGGYESKGVEDY